MTDKWQKKPNPESCSFLNTALFVNQVYLLNNVGK